MFALSSKEELIKNLGKLPDDVVFSKYPQKDEKQAIFLKEYFMYDTVNSIVVKIVQPKRIGYGMTGIYIPELADSNTLSIYARNLDSSSHAEAINIFRTIKYK